MNHDLGKTHHRKSANSNSYLKNKGRNKYTRVSYRLDSHLSNFEVSIQTGAFRKINHLRNKKKILNTYLLLKIRLRTLISLSNHLNLPENGKKCRLTATILLYAILFGTWVGPSNMAAAPWLPASLLEPSCSIQSYLWISAFNCTTLKLFECLYRSQKISNFFSNILSFHSQTF